MRKFKWERFFVHRAVIANKVSIRARQSKDTRSRIFSAWLRHVSRARLWPQKPYSPSTYRPPSHPRPHTRCHPGRRQMATIRHSGVRITTGIFQIGRATVSYIDRPVRVVVHTPSSSDVIVRVDVLCYCLYSGEISCGYKYCYAAAEFPTVRVNHPPHHKELIYLCRL